jgi:hypothetical protein
LYGVFNSSLWSATQSTIQRLLMAYLDSTANCESLAFPCLIPKSAALTLLVVNSVSGFASTNDSLSLLLFVLSGSFMVPSPSSIGDSNPPLLVDSLDPFLIVLLLEPRTGADFRLELKRRRSFWDRERGREGTGGTGWTTVLSVPMNDSRLEYLSG